MLKRKLGLAVAAILCVGLLSSCFINPPPAGSGEVPAVYKDFYNYPDGRKNAGGTLTLRNNLGYSVLCFTDSVSPANYIGTVPATGEIKVKLPDETFYNIVTVSKESYEQNQQLATQNSTLTYYSNTQAYSVQVAAENLVGGATWIFDNYTSYWVSIESLDNSETRYAVIKPNAQRVSIPVAKNKNYDYKIVYYKELKYGDKILGITEKTSMSQNDTASFFDTDTFTTSLTGTSDTSDTDLKPSVHFTNSTGKTVRVRNGQIPLANYGVYTDDYSLISGGNALFTDFNDGQSTKAIVAKFTNEWGEQACSEDIKMQKGKVYVIDIKPNPSTGSSPVTPVAPITWTITEKDATEFYQ